jgi:processive 1,2-diacylglycerol beta-glucosyltransferase
MRMQTPVQSVVICGRNQALRDEVTTLVADRAERFRVLSFTDEMIPLMRVASLCIGKPGGLTSAECMAVGLPMLIVEPIPGQEERNSDHLLESGAAIRAGTAAVIAHKLDRIFDEPGRLQQMRAATARLGRPDAAAVVVDTLLGEEQQLQQISRAERRRIIAAARGELDPALPPLADEVLVYDNDTGVYLGAMTPTQLQFLIDQLEEEGLDDTTYYLDEPTLELLAEKGAEPAFLAALRDTFAGRGYVEIRYIRTT